MYTKKEILIFAEKKGALQNVKEAFFVYLSRKYNFRISKDINLNKEWSEFIIESTSKI